MKEKKMRMHTVLVGVGCLVIGLLASAFTPRLTAQTTPEPCQAPWDVVIGSVDAIGVSGWHAVKWNRCTGETFVFSAEQERGDRVEDSSAWVEHPQR
jgi:hypothetical protein